MGIVFEIVEQEHVELLLRKATAVPRQMFCIPAILYHGRLRRQLTGNVLPNVTVWILE
jgi:hypothetical protein